MLDPLPQPFLIVSSPETECPSAQTQCARVVARVAAEFQIDPTVMTGTTRGSPKTAFARQIAMYLARVGFGLGHRAIGVSFGRDRTTVAHACRVVEDRRDEISFDRRMALLEFECRTGDGR
ncbi:MAG: hypothetical protein HY242_00360 [Afipia sp.]|nr:hypothetical protein [Afipia sp.]